MAKTDTDQQPAADSAQPDATAPSGAPRAPTGTTQLTHGSTPVLGRRGEKQTDPRLIPSHQLTPDQVQQLSQMGEDVPGTWNRQMQEKYGAEEDDLRQAATDQSASEPQQAAVVEAAVQQFRARKLAEERGDQPVHAGPPPTETVPGGAFFVSGQWVDANGYQTDAPPPRPAANLPQNAFQEHPSPVPGQAPQAFAQPATR